MSNEKFDTLEDLVQEYYELVKKNPEGLPPYAKFKEYLIDETRPEKIKELVDNLSKNDIGPILTLWSHGGDIKVDNTIYSKPDRLLHSASNQARLQSCMCEMSEDKLKDLSKELHDYITNYQSKDVDEINENHEDFFDKIKSPLKNKKCTDSKKLCKNSTPAIINEILFWYHYDEDKYPIFNSRLKNTRMMFKKIFNLNINNDVKFNEECVKSLGDKIETESFIITKQLLLDQLFYTIDEMDSMQKVDEEYSDKENKIYQFYKKLWNTIKDYKREKKSQDLNTFYNIIYHGAPGTGKTFGVIKEVEKILDLFEGGKSEFIQFHGAYTYEDFIGGLKPTANGSNLTLEYKNGIFKQLCKEAAKYEIAYYKKFPNAEPLKADTIIDEEGIELDIGNDEKFKILKNQPILSQFPPSFIIIDEINRADLSKVFGELLFAIEDDYRGFENKFKLSSSNIETKDTAVYWEGNDEKGEAYFFVPKNLYIRGTMNDIDKSVDSIDFAFRRRFKWIEKKYEKNTLKSMLEKHYNTKKDQNISEYIKKCYDLNKEIEKLSFADDSFLIGHAIFRNIIKYADEVGDILKNTEKVFDNHIEPIIYNYLKMDYGNEQNIEKFKNKMI